MKNMLPNKFGIIFDGWSDGRGNHIIGWFKYLSFSMIITYFRYAEYDNEGEKANVLLTVEVPINEVSLTAEEHIRTLNDILQGYGRSEKNILYLVGDNCSVNKKIARDMKVPLIGCHSHRLNLAVSAYLNLELMDEIECINTLMKKIKNSNKASSILK